MPVLSASRTIQAAIADENASGESAKAVFNSPEEMAAYFEANKKMLLAYAIKNDIAFEEFSDGLIKMTISDKISNDFIMNLHKELLQATGKNWKIESLRGSLGQTLAAKENAEDEENKRSISEYPLVKAILAEFKGAKIETLVRIQKEESATDNDDETETFFDEDL